MCGIIGIIGRTDVAEHLIAGLKRLEYRGYDSAGIATVTQASGKDGGIQRLRAEGKIVNLEEKQRATPLPGMIGIGHTRWATHGAPTIGNAHPHATVNVAVVHNGIIENFMELREELEAKGYRFETQTDTEVVPVLITSLLDGGMAEEDAVKAAVRRLKGAFALGILFAGRSDILMGAKQGAPLAVGYGAGEMFLGSDALALAPLTSSISYLEDGDVACLTREGVTITDAAGKKAERAPVAISLTDTQTAKGHYRHYMLKEIHEQPTVIGATLNSYYQPVTGRVALPELPFDLARISKVTIVACGTSYYAGAVAKYWLEKKARIPVDCDIASEFRYRDPILPKGGLLIVISQSGETADTLAALRHGKQHGQHTIAVVNVATSSMAREADVTLPTYAGPEIGVASTKAFTTQLVVLACLTLQLARVRNTISAEEEQVLSHSLAAIPSRATDVLNHDERIRTLAQELVLARDILYIGRGTSYPLAQEGALKLKEISYIHAEASAAGELKHGPISLVDEHVPIIAIAPSDHWFDKTAGNIQETAARGGKVILLSDKAGIAKLKGITHAAIELPEARPFSTPILYAIPIQLIAYHVAALKGTDVDQPRNLAKSVTVE